MEHKIILKCRVCLDDVDEAEMFDLFPKESHREGGATPKLSENVEYCCGVTIRESNEMPSKICIKCFDMTRMWYNFRQLCFNSQVYLESMCSDRPRPKGTDDSKYVEYLVDNLQIFRWEAGNENSEYDINFEPERSERSDSDDFFGAVPNEAHETDQELVEIMQNIKKEVSDEAEESPEFEKITNIKKEPSVKQQTLLQKKLINRMKRRCKPPSPSSYMCSECGNVYARKASFLYHMSIHRNEKPHECELCGKTFRQNSELKSHMRRHTGERPFKCSFCDRHFIDRSEKHRHERVHTNNRPYICNVCGKSFMYSAILKNHSKLHTGEKDYNCMVCQKSFTLLHQLKAHLTTIIHKQKEEEFVDAGYEVVYD